MGPTRILTPADWRRIGTCAQQRASQHGNTIRYSDYGAFQREYATFISTYAHAARLERLGLQGSSTTP